MSDKRLESLQLEEVTSVYLATAQAALLLQKADAPIKRVPHKSDLPITTAHFHVDDYSNGWADSARATGRQGMPQQILLRGRKTQYYDSCDSEARRHEKVG